MEKVKLPRYVAEALEKVLEKEKESLALGEDREFIAWCIPDEEWAKKQGEFWTVLHEYGNKKGNFFKLIDALRYGYEIEPDPITVTVTAEQIESVKELYHSTDPSPSAVGFENGWRLGFTAALDAVGIKIRGVNA